MKEKEREDESCVCLQIRLSPKDGSSAQFLVSRVVQQKTGWLHVPPTDHTNRGCIFIYYFFLGSIWVKHLSGSQTPRSVLLSENHVFMLSPTPHHFFRPSHLMFFLFLTYSDLFFFFFKSQLQTAFLLPVSFDHLSEKNKLGMWITISKGVTRNSDIFKKKPKTGTYYTQFLGSLHWLFVNFRINF